MAARGQKTQVQQAAPAKKGTGFDASKYAKPGLSVDDVVRIKECFDIFDADHSGNITLIELKNAIVALGLEKSAQEILNLISDMDTDSSDSIEFEEFLNIFGFSASLEDEKSLKDLFNQFANGKDVISLEDFSRINDLVQDRYTEAELKEMVQYADKDKDGFINWEEFQTVVTKEYGTA